MQYALTEYSPTVLLKTGGRIQIIFNLEPQNLAIATRTGT